MSAPRVLRQHGRTVLGCWPPPVVAAIADREPFVSGALRGETLATAEGVSALPWWFGGRWSDDQRTRFYNDRPTYVVFSYATPIGWWSAERGWTAPDDRYSLTTSRHQGFVSLAVSLNGSGDDPCADCGEYACVCELRSIVAALEGESDG